MPVIQRHVGRRPQHHEDPVGVDLPAGQHLGIGLEIGEVVLLLQAGIAQELGRFDPEALQPIAWNRVWHDDLRRRAHAELVLQHRAFVIMCRRTRNPQPPGAQRELVRPVREG